MAGKEDRRMRTEDPSEIGAESEFHGAGRGLKTEGSADTKNTGAKPNEVLSKIQCSEAHLL